MKMLFTLLTALCLVTAGCANAQSADVQQFSKGLAGPVQLVDVRTPEEYKEGHIPHARLMDVNDDSFEKNIASLDKTKPVYVYCRSGKRSHTAAEILRKNGFGNVMELKGGIMAWEEAGKDITTTQP